MDSDDDDQNSMLAESTFDTAGKKAAAFADTMTYGKQDKIFLPEF